MLHLNFAPSLDMLIPVLLAEVRNVWIDPFSPPNILVPSPALGKWLRMRLADRKVISDVKIEPYKCVANLPFQTIEKFLWNALQPGDYTMLDKHYLQQVLCALLNEASVNLPVFGPVRKYLMGPHGIDPLKRVQLAGRIAHQFLEYEYNRPGVFRENGRWNPEGIDGTWMKYDLFTKDNPNESWQAELYRETRHCFTKKVNDGSGTSTQYCTLPQLYRLRREQLPPRVPLPFKPATFFMFGVTKVSHFHRNLFVEFSQIDGVDIHVFLTNPCAEFWEDVDTSRSSRRRRWSSASVDAKIKPRKPDDYDKEELRDLATNAPSDDHQLLELWGNAGKENIFLWCQDTQWNFNYYSPSWVDNEKKPSSLLESLQYSLLRRNPLITPPNGCDNDKSLQILACPDHRREIEEIREQILDCVNENCVTLLNEIVVYLTDPTVYLPFIQRVFGCYRSNDPEYIPFCILETSGRETVFAQGVSTFCNILQLQFDRAHVFDLLRNPIVQATRGISSDSVAIWEQWASECAIFRGYNRTQRRQMGDTGLTVTDVHTFELGMAKMLLAELTEGAALLDFVENVGLGNHEQPLPVVPYRDFNTSDRENLELFCATVEALYRDSQTLHEAVNSGIDNAVQTFRELTNRWMGTIPDDGVVDTASEGNMLRGFYDGLSAILLQKTIASRDTIPFEEFIHLVKGCLSDEGISRSSAWTGGITFAPLRPSMVVPKTLIFVAGLDDLLFPGSNERPSWDLLSGKRIIGDSDRVRDNRFAFLEVLHAARKRCILSYRSKDMQKEADLHPSSVIQELEAYLKNQVPTEKQQPIFQREIPWIIHEALDATGRSIGSWNREQIEFARLSVQSRKDHRYDLTEKKEMPFSSKNNYHVTSYDLKTFFTNPLEYHLKYTLDLELDEAPSTTLSTDEPLDSGNIAFASLQGAIWTAVLRNVFTDRQEDSVTDSKQLLRIALETAKQLYTYHCASGRAPEAMMELMEKGVLSAWARTCIEPVLLLHETFSEHRLLERTDLSLGRKAVAVITIPLENLGTCTVECPHNLVLLPRKSASSTKTGIIAYKKEGKAEEDHGLWLEGILQWLYERQLNSSLHIYLVQLNRGDGKNKKVGSNFITLKAGDDGNGQTAKIQQWLSGFLHQMIVQRCSDHLPFAPIKKTWPDLSMKAIAEDLSSNAPSYTSYLPAFKLVDSRLPDLTDAQLKETAHLRYAPFLEKWLIDKDTHL